MIVRCFTWFICPGSVEVGYDLFHANIDGRDCNEFEPEARWKWKFLAFSLSNHQFSLLLWFGHGVSRFRQPDPPTSWCESETPTPAEQTASSETYHWSNKS